MKRTLWVTGLTMAAFALLPPALPAQAQQQTPQDLVPFKAVVKSGLNTPVAVIPGNTSLVVSVLDMTGEADFMGAVRYLELHPVQVDATGKAFGITDAVGALTAANGDALYFTLYGLVNPTATGADAVGAFTITGGKGRFAGATGSGVWRGLVDRPQNLVQVTMEAMVSRPKP